MEGFRRTQSRTLFLGVSDALADVPAIALFPTGELSVHAIIDNGADLAPTDSPVGVWQLWTSGDGVNYERQTSTGIDAELAKIATNANNRVAQCAIFVGVPGLSAKVLFVRTSGGAASRARLSFVTG